MTAPVTAPAAAPSVAWYARSAEETASAVGVDMDTGLSGKDAAARLAKNGPNALPEEKAAPGWQQFLAQYKSYMQIILVGAAIASLLIGEIATGIAVLLITALNALGGLRQQGKAESAMNALQSMLKTSARVRRDGTEVKLDADQVVVGDVVLLTAGDDVCADGRLIEAGRADVRQGDDLGRDRAGGRACPDYPRRVRHSPARRGIVGNPDEEVTMLSRGYEIHMRGAVPAQLLAEMLSAHPTLEVRTVLSGSVRDQAELQGLLRRLHSLGLELLEMRQIPDAPAPLESPPLPRKRV